MAQAVVLPETSQGLRLREMAVNQGLSAQRECETQRAHDCTPATHPPTLTARTQCIPIIQAQAQT